MSDREERPVSQAELDRAIESIRAEIRAAIAAAVQAITGASAVNLTDFRNELIERLDRVERRVERTEVNTNALLMQTAGMSRSLTEAERIDSATAVTLSTQQRVIDDLVRRLKALEDKQRPDNQA